MNLSPMYPGAEQLRDIQDIQGVPWWPPAPGWWLMAGTLLLLVLLIWRFRTAIRLRIPPLPVLKLGSWRWDAARRLRALRKRAMEADTKATAGELSELLRRIAMARLGREACAGLTGRAWLAWLEENDPKGFQWTRDGVLLLQAPYAPPGGAGTSDELVRLIGAVQEWVAAEDAKDA